MHILKALTLAALFTSPTVSPDATVTATPQPVIAPAAITLTDEEVATLGRFYPGLRDHVDSDI